METKTKPNYRLIVINNILCLFIGLFFPVLLLFFVVTGFRGFILALVCAFPNAVLFAIFHIVRENTAKVGWLAATSGVTITYFLMYPGLTRMMQNRTWQINLLAFGVYFLVVSMSGKYFVRIWKKRFGRIDEERQNQYN